MARRLELQELLEFILGSSNVYFQPPNNLQLSYPCIVYNRDDEEQLRANNLQYRVTNRYQVTVMDRNPDSLIPQKISALPTCAFDRDFKSDDLNHTVYNLYF